MYEVGGKGGWKAEVDNIIHSILFMRASERTTPDPLPVGKHQAWRSVSVHGGRAEGV